MNILCYAVLTVGLIPLAGTALAADAAIPLIIKDHRFEPAEIHIKAGIPTVLMVHNQDNTVEEVESRQLNIEKVIPPGASSKIRLRPLEPGRYTFMGEYHSDTAQGTIIVE